MNIKQWKYYLIGILIIIGINIMGFFGAKIIDKSQQEIYDAGFRKGVELCEFYQKN